MFWEVPSQGPSKTVYLSYFPRYTQSKWRPTIPLTADEAGEQYSQNYTLDQDTFSSRILKLHIVEKENVHEVTLTKRSIDYKPVISWRRAFGPLSQMDGLGYVMVIPHYQADH